MNWLVKEEPTHYGFDALVKDKKAVWSGVRNALAQKHLRAIKKGDRIFYYHTGDEKAVVGIVKARSDAYPDPEDASGKYVAVDVARSSGFRGRSRSPKSRQTQLQGLSAGPHRAVVGDACHRCGMGGSKAWPVRPASGHHRGGSDEEDDLAAGASRLEIAVASAAAARDSVGGRRA